MLIFFRKWFRNAKSGPKFGRRGVVLVILMPGEKGSGTPFRIACFWERTFGTAFRCVPSQKYPCLSPFVFVSQHLGSWKHASHKVKCLSTLCQFVELVSGAGRAMAQAVSRWPVTAEARVRARVNPCGICGGQSGTGQVFSEYFGFPCKYHSTIAPYSPITALWGVRLHWPSSTLSQPRPSVRGFTSDPADWLETERKKEKSGSH
jgi:hypothetical protein